MVGGDVAYKLTDQLSLNASVGTTLMSSLFFKVLDDELDSAEAAGFQISKSSSILTYQFKCDYLINQNFGINLGYKALLPTAKYSMSYGSLTTKLSYEQSISAITLGALYKF